jgi:hypothetical protein
MSVKLGFKFEMSIWLQLKMPPDGGERGERAAGSWVSDYQKLILSYGGSGGNISLATPTGQIGYVGGLDFHFSSFRSFFCRYCEL